MAAKAIMINRAPVLTLWAAVVAENLGFDADEALTLGKTVAGLNAQSKGQRLGIFKPSPKEVREARGQKPSESFRVDLLGRGVPVVNTDEGIRAVNKDRPVDPDSVRTYLGKKFGDSLAAAREAMEDLAKAFDPEELAEKAYSLYEQFRPEIPPGKRGWGAQGKLDLEFIRSLAG